MALLSMLIKAYAKRRVSLAAVSQKKQDVHERRTARELTVNVLGTMVHARPRIKQRLLHDNHHAQT